MLRADLTGRELVVHLFAPLDGPDAAAAADHLAQVWRRCQRGLGISHEVIGLGLPAALPDGWFAPGPGHPDHVALAACARRGTGVFQAILRRHHDVANLSVVLAPAPGASDEETSWTSLDELWAQAAGEATAAQPPAARPSMTEPAVAESAMPGPMAAGLLGVVRIYVGRLRGGSPAALAARSGTAQLLAGLLPCAVASNVDRNRASIPLNSPATMSGPAVMSGLAMWEADLLPDGRSQRRIALLGAEEDDARLSAWAWSRGTPEMPPFARYLLHAAKVRYHLRVWGDGRAVRGLRDDVEALTTALARTLDADPVDDQAGGIPGQLARLRAGQAHLINTSSALERMRRAVDVARWNMSEALGGAQGVGAVDGLFREDARLVEWFVQQLVDDQALLEASTRRARGITDLAREHAQALTERLPGIGHDARAGWEDSTHPHWAADVPLTWEDRELLQRELAAVFPSEAAAAAMLDRVGLARDLRPTFTGSTPRDVWRAIVIDLENGRVDAPHRRLIAAALVDFPFNRVFLDLALRTNASA